MSSLGNRLQTKFGTEIVDLSEEGRSAATMDWTPISAKRRATGAQWAIPDAVVRPRSEDDVVQLLRWATEQRVAVYPFGGRSSVVGGTGPTDRRPGFALDTGGLSDFSINETDYTVVAQAGVFGGTLIDALHERGLELANQPQSLYLSTVGGWVATRASGIFAAGYGAIESIVTSMRVVLPSGEVAVSTMGPRRSVGPDLGALFLGSEGTLGIVTEVGLTVRPLPNERKFNTYAFKSLDAALGIARELACLPGTPALLRVFDASEASHYYSDADGESLLLVAWDNPPEVATAMKTFLDRRVFESDGEDVGDAPALTWYKGWYDSRWMSEVANTPGGFIDTLDIAVPWSKVPEAYSQLRSAASAHVSRVDVRFSHIYPGGACMYVIVRDTFPDDDAALAAYEGLWTAVSAKAVELGLGLSHHHGVGRLRAPWWQQERKGDLSLLRQIKQVLDPEGLMNPGVLDYL